VGTARHVFRPYSEPFSEVTAPNQLWCMDFKGHFSTSDDARCDPFTITDAHSRYLIRYQTVSRMDLNLQKGQVSGLLTGEACAFSMSWSGNSCATFGFI